MAEPEPSNVSPWYLRNINQAPSQLAFAFEEQLQRDSFTGTAFEYVITATTTGNNQDLFASIEWQEVS
jgi:hypothetical protein